jgi:uncharacterized DUF497 family protein
MRISDLVIDDVNIDKFSRHGISAIEVLDTIDDEPLCVIKNSSSGRGNAPYALIGRAASGRIIVVPIDQRDTGIWRPRTAFEATDQRFLTAYRNTHRTP